MCPFGGLEFQTHTASFSQEPSTTPSVHPSPSLSPCCASGIASSLCSALPPRYPPRSAPPPRACYCHLLLSTSTTLPAPFSLEDYLVAACGLAPRAFYLKAIIKDGSNLYAPKKFVGTCMSNFIFVYTRASFCLFSTVCSSNMWDQAGEMSILPSVAWLLAEIARCPRKLSLLYKKDFSSHRLQPRCHPRPALQRWPLPRRHRSRRLRGTAPPPHFRQEPRSPPSSSP